MKILQLAHSFPTHNIAGVEVYTYNLCKELSLNHEVHVFHRINEPNRREYEVRYHCEQGLHIHTINNTFKHCYSFEELYINSDIEEAFMSVVEKINPDIVHIQHLIFLSAGIIKRLKERAIPMIFSLHDYWLICPQWHYLQSRQLALHRHVRPNALLRPRRRRPATLPHGVHSPGEQVGGLHAVSWSGTPVRG